VTSICATWHADRDWPLVMAAMAGGVKVNGSSTLERGFALAAADTAALLAHAGTVPRSFPAKLVVLLHHRWRLSPKAALSLYPCELVSRNGETPCDIVVGLARSWGADEAFLAYVQEHGVWVNSLVDRNFSAYAAQPRAHVRACARGGGRVRHACRPGRGRMTPTQAA